MYKKPKRKVNRVFLHCSASNNASHDDVSVMRQWHLARGWKDVGYHFFIKRNGVVQDGRPVANVPAAQEGHNTGTIAVCLHGLYAQDFTEQQFDSLRALCAEFDDAHADLTYHGHREVANKLCPVFDYRAVLGLDANGRRVGKFSPPSTPEREFVPDLLRVGSRGDEVSEIQRLLGLQATGVYDAQLETAVRTFQWGAGLLADGVVGNDTRTELRKVKNG